MRTGIIIFLSSLLVLLAFNTTLAFTNIAADPSFETDELISAASGDASCNFIWTDAVSHTGKRSLQITNYSGSSPAYWQKEIAVTGGENYFITVWVRADGLTSGKINLACYTPDNSKIVEGLPLTSSAFGEWQLVTLLISVPDGLSAIKVRLQVAGLNGTASVYFDDLVVFMLPGKSLLLKDVPANPEINADRLPISGAYGNYTTGLLKEADIYTKNNFFLGNITTFPAGNYKLRVRYHGSPTNSPGNGVYEQYIKFCEDTPGAPSDVKLPEKSDNIFHYQDADVRLENTSSSPNVKSMKVAGWCSTNPIDWIWVGHEADQIPAELEKLNNVGAPSNLAADTSTPGKVTLTWSASADYDVVYQIYLGTEPNFSLSEAVRFGKTADCTFTGDLDPELVNAHEKFYFKVVAWNSLYVGSAPSNEVAIKSDNVPPGTPVEFSVDVETIPGLVLLSWKPAPLINGERAEGFIIYRVEGDDEFTDEPYVIITEDTPGFSNDPDGEPIVWKDMNVKQQTKYRYKISAFDKPDSEGNFNESVCTEVIEAVTKLDTAKPNKPNPPSADTEHLGVDAETTLGAVILSWKTPAPHSTDLDPAVKFAIYRSLSADPRSTYQQPGGAKIIVDVPEAMWNEGFLLTYTDIEVQPGVEYYYAVASIDKVGNESEELLDAATKVAVLEPYKATIVAPVYGAGIIGGTLSFKWDAPTAYDGDTVVGYYIVLATDEDFSADEMRSSLIEDDTEYEWTTPLEPGTWFWFVETVYESGVKSRSEIGKIESIADHKNRARVPFLSVVPQIFNPAKGSLEIQYAVNKDGYAAIRLFDLQGRLIAIIQDKQPVLAKDADGFYNNYHLLWSGTKEFPRGIYYVQLEFISEDSRSSHIVRKIQVVR